MLCNDIEQFLDKKVRIKFLERRLWIFFWLHIRAITYIFFDLAHFGKLSDPPIKKGYRLYLG